MDRQMLLREITAQVEALADQEIGGTDREIFREGFLDSLNIIHLIAWLEKKYSFKVEAFDVGLKTFATVELIADYVLRKSQGHDAL